MVYLLHLIVYISSILLIHALGIEVRIESDFLVIEVFYEDDTPAEDCRITMVSTQSGKTLQTLTNDKGSCKFELSQLERGDDYEIIADPGDGHRATKRFTVPQSDLPFVEKPITTDREKFEPRNRYSYAFLGCLVILLGARAWFILRQRQNQASKLD